MSGVQRSAAVCRRMDCADRENAACRPPKCSAQAESQRCMANNRQNATGGPTGVDVRKSTACVKSKALWLAVSVPGKEAAVSRHQYSAGRRSTRSSSYFELLVVCEWGPAARLGDQVALAADPCAVPIRASQRHGWV